MGRKLVLDNDFDTLGTPAQNALADPHAVSAASMAALSAAAGGPPKIDDPRDCHTRLYQGIKHHDEWLRDAEVRELTGEDEEALAKVGGSWIRFMDSLVMRGTVKIGGLAMTRDVADSLLIGDRDALLVAIRIATFGEVLELSEYECSGCGEKMDLEIKLTALPEVSLETPGEPLRVTLRDGSEAVVRYPNGADQRAVYDDPDLSAAAQNTELLARCLISLSGEPMPLSPAGRAIVVRQLGLADRRKLLRTLSDTQPGPRLDQIEYVHEACGTVIKLPLSIGDLFLGV